MNEGQLCHIYKRTFHVELVVLCIEHGVERNHGSIEIS